jgi:hypothetical protein
MTKEDRKKLADKTEEVAGKLWRAEDAAREAIREALGVEKERREALFASAAANIAAVLTDALFEETNDEMKAALIQHQLDAVYRAGVDTGAKLGWCKSTFTL